MACGKRQRPHRYGPLLDSRFADSYGDPDRGPKCRMVKCESRSVSYLCSAKSRSSVDFARALRPAIRVPRYARGNNVQKRGCHTFGRGPGSMPGERWTSRRPGLHLDQNVLGLLRRDSPGLDSGPLGWPLFGGRTARSAPVLLFWRKRGTRKSRLETKSENEAQFSPSSASLVPPTPAKPRQPRGKSHPSLQCHNWADWVADGAVWSHPVSEVFGFSSNLTVPRPYPTTPPAAGKSESVKQTIGGEPWRRAGAWNGRRAKPS